MFITELTFCHSAKESQLTHHHLLNNSVQCDGLRILAAVGTLALGSTAVLGPAVAAPGLVALRALTWLVQDVLAELANEGIVAVELRHAAAAFLFEVRTILETQFFIWTFNIEIYNAQICLLLQILAINAWHGPKSSPSFLIPHLLHSLMCSLHPRKNALPNGLWHAVQMIVQFGVHIIWFNFELK